METFSSNLFIFLPTFFSWYWFCVMSLFYRQQNCCLVSNIPLFLYFHFYHFLNIYVHTPFYVKNCLTIFGAMLSVKGFEEKATTKLRLHVWLLVDISDSKVRKLAAFCNSNPWKILFFRLEIRVGRFSLLAVENNSVNEVLYGKQYSREEKHHNWRIIYYSLLP